MTEHREGFLIGGPEFERDGVVLRQDILPRETIDRLRPYFDAVETRRPGARGFDISPAIASLISETGPLGGLAARRDPCAFSSSTRPQRQTGRCRGIRTALSPSN